MDAILSFLTQPQIQFILTLAGGWLLKRWPAFFNKLIPATLVGAQVLLALLSGLFGVHPAEASTLGSLFGGAGQTLLQGILQAIAMAVMAIGTHSAIKNSSQGLAVKR